MTTLKSEVRGSNRDIFNIFHRARNSFRENLSLKIMVVLLPVVLIVIGVGAYFLRGFIQEIASNFFTRHLVRDIESLEMVMQHTFMVNDMDMLRQLIKDISYLNEANSIRVIDMDRNIVASTFPDENNIQLTLDDRRCSICHAGGESLNDFVETRSFDSTEEEVFYIANRIENRVPCQSCHGVEAETLGLVLAEFPAEPVETWLGFIDYGSMGIMLVIGILVAGIVSVTITQSVSLPLRVLLRQSDLVEQYEGKDEIERTAGLLVQMQKITQDSKRALAEEHKKIDSVFSIQYDTDNPPTLEKFFRQALGILVQVTGYDSITMRSYDPHKKNFKLMVQKGMSPAMIRDLDRIPDDQGFHAEIMQTMAPAYTSDMLSDARMTSKAPMEEGYRSLICIPLMSQDLLVGSIQLATKETHLWDDNEIRWLALIGRRVGLLVHQIQLTEQLREMAIREERARISQEIHDGLAQLIGSMRIWSEEAWLSLEQQHLGDTRQALKKIESAAKDAFVSLREEMLGLRDTINPGQTLDSLIKEYLKRFQRQWGIETIFHINGFVDRTLDVSPVVEIQLLRIIQEGLTNVRRHAEASEISVTLSQADSRLIVIIEDNGKGFSLDQIEGDKLGLRIMRERANSVGGELEINTNPGTGVALVIKVPMQVQISAEGRNP